MRNLTATQRFVLFNTWSSAIDRCHNPRNKSHENYGGRGIVVCDRWRDSFDAFAKDMGPRPDGLSLDRVDVNGPYSPNNCRWADSFVQARNKRNTKLTSEDVEDILRAAKKGVPVSALEVFYGVTGTHIRKITAGVRPPLAVRGAPGATLTEDNVRELRALYAVSPDVRYLAERFGIKPRNVYNVVQGKTWKHVA